MPENQHENADGLSLNIKWERAMTEVYYSPSYVGSSLEFDTTRKSGWIADSLLTSPIAGIELVEPQSLTGA